MGMGIGKRDRKSISARAFCEQLEPRQLYNGVGMATANKDSQTLFGNVTMVNSAAYEAQLSSGASFTSTLGSLPAHTELTSVGFTVGVTLGPSEDENNVVFNLTVDGQPVPVYVAWFQPGLASASMNLSMLPHTSDTAGISLTVSEPGSDDTFDVSSEGVVADQDAWINAIQTDMYRDNDQPAVFDLVRGDDSGTPQAPGQPQDIYFNLADGGYMPGLVNSDGSITPIDPNAAYADFGITVAGQNGGVSFDPSTGLFKATIPATQSTVELDFIPTNPPDVASANAFFFQIGVQGTATDPSSQIGFEFNAPASQPATQRAALHGLVAVDSAAALDNEELEPLLTDLDSENWQVRADAIHQIEAILASDPSAAAYNQLYQDALSASDNRDFGVSKGLDEALRKVFPLGFPQLEANQNKINGLHWPRWVANQFTGTNRIQLDVSADPGVAHWVSPNEVLRGLVILYADGTPPPQLSPIPEIGLTPTETGPVTVTITAEPQAMVGGLFQDIGNPVVEKIVVDIINTDP